MNCHKNNNKGINRNQKQQKVVKTSSVTRVKWIGNQIKDIIDLRQDTLSPNANF